MFSKLLALLLLILLSPLFFLLFVLVKVSSKGPFIFKQLRAGKNKSPLFINTNDG
jgi:O-antigen biosynthesis protein WbqP